MDLENELEEPDIYEEEPIVVEDAKSTIYLPNGTTTQKGINSYNPKDFRVDPNGKVSLSEDLVQIKEHTEEALSNSNQATETANDAKSIAENALEQVVEGEGTKIYVNEQLVPEIHVDSDIQDQFDQLTEDVEDIQELVPNQASAQNQLADKNFVNSSINAIAAFYITYDSQGNPFPTKAALSSATTFYSGGEARVPTRNDYCLVLADETHDNASCRYVYSGEYPNGQWDFQFVVNETPFTSDQVAAINSGITSGLVQQIPNKLDKRTSNNVVYINNAQGEPSILTYSPQSGMSNSIVQRKTNGAIAVPTPTVNEDAVPKSYVDTVSSRKAYFVNNQMGTFTGTGTTSRITITKREGQYITLDNDTLIVTKPGLYRILLSAIATADIREVYLDTVINGTIKDQVSLWRGVGNMQLELETVTQLNSGDQIYFQLTDDENSAHQLWRVKILMYEI